MWISLSVPRAYTVEIIYRRGGSPFFSVVLFGSSPLPSACVGNKDSLPPPTPRRKTTREGRKVVAMLAVFVEWWGELETNKTTSKKVWAFQNILSTAYHTLFNTEHFQKNKLFG
jgi:hypothetical protein